MKTDVNVECWPPEPKAVRSNRAGRTIKFKHLQEIPVSAFLFVFSPRSWDLEQVHFEVALADAVRILARRKNQLAGTKCTKFCALPTVTRCGNNSQ